MRVLIIDIVERETLLELRAEQRLTLDGRVQKEMRGVREAGREKLQERRVALLFGLLDELVDLLLACDQQRVNDFLVEEARSTCCRRQHP